MIYMSNYDRILDYAKENNDYITSNEIQKLGINIAFLSNLAHK